MTPRSYTTTRGTIRAVVLLSRGDSRVMWRRLDASTSAPPMTETARRRCVWRQPTMPNFLQRANLLAVQGDPAAAVFWYDRARELGAAEAEMQLKDIQKK